MKNIVLIGMPGAGKSTLGVILAKLLGYNFIDSDLLIQEKAGCLLKDIIKDKGLQGLIDIENEVNQNIQVNKTVISTGGSVIYGKEAMEHLKEIGIICYIKLSFETISTRLDNIEQRGVVFKQGQSLKSLYEERTPLYEKYADIVIDAEGLGIEDTLKKAVDLLNHVI